MSQGTSVIPVRWTSEARESKILAQLGNLLRLCLKRKRKKRKKGRGRQRGAKDERREREGKKEKGRKKE